MGDKPHNAQDIEQIVRLRALLRRAVPLAQRQIRECQCMEGDCGPCSNARALLAEVEATRHGEGGESE